MGTAWTSFDHSMARVNVPNEIEELFGGERPMALIKCTECGHEISDTAATCPNCGHKNEQRSSGGGCLKVVLLLFGGLVLLVLLGLCTNSGDDPSSRVDNLVKRCTAEAGIPSNQPNHVVTPQEMDRLASCLDRNR